MTHAVDAVVVGAGMWGCTLARRLAEAGRRVLVLEKRAAVGGNCRCEIDPETGIEVHTYGSHIFHTSNRQVWDFVSRFTGFNDYRHVVLARARAGERWRNEVEVDKGGLYHLPIGCTLLKEFFGRDIRPSELTDEERNAVFDAFVRGYTSKQWGVPPDKVDPAVIKRLKVRDNDSTRYFDDLYEGIPTDGYNEMFRRMLDHPSITVKTSSSLKLELEKGRFVIFNEKENTSLPLSTSTSALHLYYSGPIDALFGYKFGALPWRSLRFETEKLPVADFQGNSVVNYPDVEVAYTRIHEFRHYHLESNGGVHPTIEQANKLSNRTIIMREYPCAWKVGDEPYYPISNPESAALLAKYQEEVRRLSAENSALRLVVGGRLGAYKYYDMDKAVAAAMEVGG